MGYRLRTLSFSIWHMQPRTERLRGRGPRILEAVETADGPPRLSNEPSAEGHRQAFRHQATASIKQAKHVHPVCAFGHLRAANILDVLQSGTASPVPELLK